jgi:multidrug resistance efflux pump
VESLIFKIQNIIDSDSLIEVTFNQNLILGDLLNSYEQLVKNYNEFNLHIELNPQENEISILKKQILEYETLLSKQQIQEQIYAEELELIKKDFERNNQLYNNNVITAREQEDKNRSFLQAKRIHEDIKISISNTKITINNIKKSIQNLHSENRINNSQGKQAIREAMVNLKSGISIWKQNYLIQAPVSGKISFFNFWSINQNVNLGDIVFTIVPSNSFQIIGKMIMPLHNSGKVNLGQKVYVQLNEFPYAEYGMLEGTIENLSLVARKDNYALEVTFHNGLNTNFHKTLPLRQEMKGSAKIITKDLSLLDRVFFQFRNAIIK